MQTHTTRKLHQSWEGVKEELLNPRLSRKLITGKKIMLARIRIKKGGAVPMHKHHHEQMCFLLKGSLKFNLAGKEYLMSEGEVLQIPSNQEHGVLALRDSVALDVFSPIREDWLSGDDSYLRNVKTRGKPKRKSSKNHHK